jgi:glycosyltransferase involved in cell wall biosynthesis
MKVLVVSEPGVDGVFRYVEMLCEFLARQGFGVHLAYSDRRGSDRLPRLVAAVEERGGRTLNLRTANRPSLADIGAFWSLARLVREVRPDVIHSHSSKAGFLARSLAFLRCRAVQVYHPHAYVGMRPTPGRFDRIYNLVEAVLGRVSCTVVVSSGERRFARERLRIPPECVRLVRNGVDTTVFAPVSAEEKRRRRAELGLPENLPLLGFLGRSSPQKDPMTLYRAFAQAAADKPVGLFHVGKGELDGQLDALVQQAGLGGRVFRRTYMNTPADFYAVVDGFILTSRYEGFSLALLEALSGDLPLIVSTAPGNEDLLAQPLSHCWPAAAGDVDGFADAIREWHDRLGDGFPCNHRGIARSVYDSRHTCAAVANLYRQLVRVEPQADGAGALGRVG